jgi:hypothetical protein
MAARVHSQELPTDLTFEREVAQVRLVY